jgi:hypothetical protein
LWRYPYLSPQVVKVVKVVKIGFPRHGDREFLGIGDFGKFRGFRAWRRENDNLVNLDNL